MGGTYWVLDILAGTLYVFVIVIITYFAGVLVWKDRDQRVDEIIDSLPTPEWVSYLSRFVALVVQLLALAGGVIVQVWYGYHRFQFGLYLNQLIVRDLSFFIFFAAVAFFIHALSPNKYLGYFFYFAFAIANVFVWSPLNIASYLVRFGITPDVVYSDFYGDAPYIKAWRWFTLYWALFCGLLAIGTVMFWPRGKQACRRERWRNASLGFTGSWRAAALACFLCFAATGAWIYYNTKLLNQLLGPKDQQRLHADYEKSYKRFAKLPEPRVRGVKYAIDIFPETRNATVHGEELISNPYSHPLDEVHFSLDRRYDTTLDVLGATLVNGDTRLAYQIYGRYRGFRGSGF